MAPTWSKLSSEEIRLAKMWYHEDDYAPSEIASLLHRDKSTLTRLLCAEQERKQDGRPPAFTEKQVDKMVETLEAMILKANKEYRVTGEMLMKEMRTKASKKTVLNALHERDICFRPNRDKPDLTDDDITDRFLFGTKYVKKPDTFWTETLNLTIDVKYFKVTRSESYIIGTSL